MTKIFCGVTSGIPDRDNELLHIQGSSSQLLLFSISYINKPTTVFILEVSWSQALKAVSWNFFSPFVDDDRGWKDILKTSCWKKTELKLLPCDIYVVTV